MSVELLKQFFTNGTFAQEAVKAGGTAAIEALKSVNPLYAALGVGGGAAVLGTAYGLYTRGRPTIESMRGHLATAGSYLNPMEYNVVKSRMRPGKPKSE